MVVDTQFHNFYGRFVSYLVHYTQQYGYHVTGPAHLGKMWKPLLSTDTRGTRETREIVMSRTSSRTLLLHMPLTDLLRRIYRLADSRSGTLESPTGRFFDLSGESREHDNCSPSDHSFSPVPVSPSCLQITVLVRVVTHSAVRCLSLIHI